MISNNKHRGAFLVNSVVVGYLFMFSDAFSSI